MSIKNETETYLFITMETETNAKVHNCTSLILLIAIGNMLTRKQLVVQCVGSVLDLLQWTGAYSPGL